MPERAKVPSVSPGGSLLSHFELESSMRFLASLQLQSGMIPWFRSGRADPWNHSEAALALALGGRLEEALAAAQWLLKMQNSDGSWCHFYLSSGIAEPRRDTNTCCFPVLLVSLLDCMIGDRRELEPYVDMALRGVDLVVSHQRSDGSIPWAIDPDGSTYPTSLKAASSSVYDSLLVAADLSDSYSKGKGLRYREARERLSSSISSSNGKYSFTSGWAMDHYYPFLAGLSEFSSLTESFLDRFYLPNWGIRCIESNDWFTAAETAETAMALHIAGEEALAQDLFAELERFRSKDGGYLTGVVSPSGNSFPHMEQSAYSVGAVVIASFVLAAKSERSAGTTILSLFS